MANKGRKNPLIPSAEKTTGPAIVYHCHCEERSDVAIRFLPVPLWGDGRCFAPLGMRIATSGFALLAMTLQSDTG